MIGAKLRPVGRSIVAGTLLGAGVFVLLFVLVVFIAPV
jgi:hypothetical protein